MNYSKIAGLIFWALLSSSVAFAEKPPVDVQVVVGDDEEEDFFEEKPEAKKEEAPADENSSVKVEKKGDGGNVNTNVIHVVVGGQQQEAKAQASEKEVEIESLEADMASARERIEAKKAETPAPSAPPADAAPATAAATVHHEGSHHWWKSWSKSPGVREGDVLFSILGGKNGEGGFAGGALEFMLDDKMGLRGRGYLSVVGGDEEFRAPFAQDDGRWAGLTNAHFTGADHAAVHMFEVVAAYHFSPKKRFDPYVTFGVSHFGYFLDRGDEPDIGGAVYARGGIGFNWFWKSLFIGAELGWYPGELMRYTAEPVAGSSDGDRRVVVVEDVRDRWDAKRVNFAAHVGLRF